MEGFGPNIKIIFLLLKRLNETQKYVPEPYACIEIKITTFCTPEWCSRTQITGRSVQCILQVFIRERYMIYV